jgi:hypothetical protein
MELPDGRTVSGVSRSQRKPARNRTGSVGLALAETRARTMFLGPAAVDPREIRRGARELAAALERELRSGEVGNLAGVRRNVGPVEQAGAAPRERPDLKQLAGKERH